MYVTKAFFSWVFKFILQYGFWCIGSHFLKRCTALLFSLMIAVLGYCSNGSVSLWLILQTEAVSEKGVFWFKVAFILLSAHFCVRDPGVHGCCDRQLVWIVPRVPVPWVFTLWKPFHWPSSQLGTRFFLLPGMWLLTVLFPSSHSLEWGLLPWRPTEGETVSSFWLTAKKHLGSGSLPSHTLKCLQPWLCDRDLSHKTKVHGYWAKNSKCCLESWSELLPATDNKHKCCGGVGWGESSRCLDAFPWPLLKKTSSHLPLPKERETVGSPTPTAVSGVCDYRHGGGLLRMVHHGQQQVMLHLSSSHSLGERAQAARACFAL